MTTFNEIIAGGFKSDEPKIGMGVTELCYSDRHAYTIAEIVSPRRVIIFRDRATRTDNNGMSDMQTYVFEPDPQGKMVEISRRKDGHWREVGQGRGSNIFMLGHREEYYDYSF